MLKLICTPNVKGFPWTNSRIHENCNESFWKATVPDKLLLSMLLCPPFSSSLTPVPYTTFPTSLSNSPSPSLRPPYIPPALLSLTSQSPNNPYIPTLLPVPKYLSSFPSSDTSPPSLPQILIQLHFPTYLPGLDKNPLF